MYRCYNPKRFFFLLMLDGVAVLLWILFSMISRSVLSAEKKPEGIFLPVIMYHSITETDGSDYKVSADQLEMDLQYLQTAGYTSVSAEELVQYTEGTGELPEHPVMLTFDDGFYNNLSTALPLLEKYDMCAVISVVGEYTDTAAVRDPHIDAYSYLTWQDIETLLESGRIEIGSHTYDLHSNSQRAGCSIMYGEDESSYQNMLIQDLSRLQQEMKEQTGTMPEIFAYPYGYVCRESIPVLRELGFVCTLTCYERPNYITRDRDCLYGLCRYNRSPSESTETFFRRVLTE